MKCFAAVAAAVCLALAGQVSAAPVEGDVAKRAPYSGQATYFAPGLGSCGGTDTAQSMIVRRRLLICDSRIALSNPVTRLFE
jgi:hypothetical protein